MKRKSKKEIPQLHELREELRRVKYKHRYHSVLRSTIYTLITVAAIAVQDGQGGVAGIFHALQRLSDGKVVKKIGTTRFRSQKKQKVQEKRAPFGSVDIF